MADSLDLLDQWLLAKRKREQFHVPENARPAFIQLVSSGETYLPEFLQGLYVLEQAMADKGFDPTAFTLDKHAVNSGAPYIQEIYVYSYTISFHGNSYSVRREGDMAFLAYFSTLILSDEHEEFDEPHAQSRSFFSKLVGWLEADTLTPSVSTD